MKKAIKKVLVSALAVLLVVGFTAPAAAAPVKAASSKVTVKTSTSKKVKTKTYKLKKKVKRKKVTTKKTKKTSKKVITSVSKKVEETVQTDIVVKTTKKAKKKTVKTTTTIKKVIKTTNLAQAGNANISQLKGIVDDKVISEFNRVGMTIETNPNSSLLKGADGVFSPSQKKIVIKNNVNRVLVHEVGHFVAYVNNRADSTAKFRAIYNAEKNNFAGDNRAYAVSNNKEFFAEVFKEYSMNRASLKSHCPRAYEYVKNVLADM